MRVEVRQVEGLTMIGKAESNHWVVMDARKSQGGTEGGSSPMELILVAFGGCLAMTAVPLLRKRVESLDEFAIQLDAQQAEEHPHVFTRIDVKCVVEGKGVGEQDVAWAVTKAREKYCPVGAMLGRVAEVSYSWEVIDLLRTTHPG